MYFHDCTLSRVTCGELHVFGLELPWLGNQANYSCIPVGEYQCELGRSAHLGDVIRVKDVVGRSGILIHVGNYTRQIQGCLLVGRGLQFLDGDSVPDLSFSKDALAALIKAAGKTPKLIIRGEHG
jgi:hypothetical protein